MNATNTIVAAVDLEINSGGYNHMIAKEVENSAMFRDREEDDTIDDIVFRYCLRLRGQYQEGVRSGKKVYRMGSERKEHYIHHHTQYQGVPDHLVNGKTGCENLFFQSGFQAGYKEAHSRFHKKVERRYLSMGASPQVAGMMAGHASDFVPWRNCSRWYEVTRAILMAGAKVEKIEHLDQEFHKNTWGGGGYYVYRSFLTCDPQVALKAVGATVREEEGETFFFFDHHGERFGGKVQATGLELRRRG